MSSDFSVADLPSPRADTSPDSDTGFPIPLGPYAWGTGTNFAIFSRHATRIWLELYEGAHDAAPQHRFESDAHRTDDIWVDGVEPNQLYGYRAEGPYAPEKGHRFNPYKLLLDPYARAITHNDNWGFWCARGHDPTAPQDDRSFWTVDNAGHVPKCVVTERQTGWENQRPLRHSWSDTVIYELHVRGFTIHESADVDHPGTFRGLTEKIPYLKDLGVTAVELMPVQEFNEDELARVNPLTGEPFKNYWGYNPAAFMAPNGAYSSAGYRGDQVREFKKMVRDLILDALRYWVAEMHVDGFRFDLASVLGRDEDGSLMADPPLLDRIAQDPVLSDVKMIAEAWDAAGAYQVGTFHNRWSEWNGRFRDDVRRFWRGDPGMLGDFASRLAGRSDLYGGTEKGPESSINYVTSHDGFTLNDLVTYAEKHNEANGEFNRDGPTANYSANYGVEGLTDDPEINDIRTRQVKNFLLTLLLSHGVPMLLGGDEFRRTQQDNNNAYCQDNEIGWWVWDRREEHDNIHRFVHELIAARKAHSPLRHPGFYSDDTLRWIGPGGRPPQWDDPDARAVGCYLPEKEGLAVLLLFNAGTEAVEYELPDPPGDRTWARKADTSRSSPDDIHPLGEAPPLDQQDRYTVADRTSVVLIAG